MTSLKMDLFSEKFPNAPSLEGWIIVKIRHGDKLPIIGRINLNKRIPAFQGEAAAAHA
jgi:hypothetical protein